RRARPQSTRGCTQGSTHRSRKCNFGAHGPLGNQELVGAYDFRQHYFRFYAADEDKWLAHTQPPFPVPVVQPGQQSGEVGFAEDYGIPLYMFPPRGEKEERWTRQGKAASKADLLKLLEPKPKVNPQPAGPDQASTGPAVLGSLLLLLAFLAHKLPKEKSWVRR